MKICTECTETRPLTDFFVDKRNGGRMARCKKCKTNAYRSWREKNPGYDKRRYWANPQGERERHLVRKYGVTLALYQQMFDGQRGCCAICGRTQARAFDVDHDHATGDVRGLLCTSCNRMIGHAGDSPDTLEAAAVYLRSSRKSLPSSSQPRKPHVKKARPHDQPTRARPLVKDEQ